MKRWGKLGKTCIKLVPKKSGPVAVTVHNISLADRPWFEDVIDHLGEKYGFITPSDIEGTLMNKIDDNRILLTFDDGFRSNRIVAEEILCSRNIKAIFFVTEGFVGLSNNNSFLFAQERFYPATKINSESADEFAAMQWSDLSWLIDQGHEIGAHTKNHSSMASLLLEELTDEIIYSANRIEERVGKKIRFFAYPFGRISDVDVTALKLAQERFSLSFSNLRGGLSESPHNHFLFRQNLAPGMPMWFVEAAIEGRLDWRYRKNRKKAMDFAAAG